MDTLKEVKKILNFYKNFDRRGIDMRNSKGFLMFLADIVKAHHNPYGGEQASLLWEIENLEDEN